MFHDIVGEYKGDNTIIFSSGGIQNLMHVSSSINFIFYGGSMENTDVLEKEILSSLSGIRIFIANTLNAIGKIYKLNPNDAFTYVSDKLKKKKETVSPKEYEMAEEASERWADQISSVSFLDNHFAGNNDVLAAKANVYGNETNQQVELFKKNLTIEIIQSIKKVKSKKRNSLNLRCEWVIPEEVQNAAKKSNINPTSISADKSGVIIYLNPAKAVFMKGGRDAKNFDLEEDKI